MAPDVYSAVGWLFVPGDRPGGSVNNQGPATPQIHNTAQSPTFEAASPRACPVVINALGPSTITTRSIIGGSYRTRIDGGVVMRPINRRRALVSKTTKSPPRPRHKLSCNTLTLTHHASTSSVAPRTTGTTRTSAPP
jgi:hypothetical protein